MRLRLLALLLALLGSGPGPEAQPAGAVVTGRVTAQDKGKAVADYPDAFVYLKEVGHHRADDAPGAKVAAKIVQQGEKFVPAAIVVPVGATVSFPNLDRVYHNVFSSTMPSFDLGKYNTDRTGPNHVFEDADEFDIYCDIHRQMSASVKVVESRPEWIAKVVRGGFRIEGVPDGHYKVVAWAPHADEEVTVEIRIDHGQIAILAGGKSDALDKINIQLKPAPPHVRKDGSAYRPYVQ